MSYLRIDTQLVGLQADPYFRYYLCIAGLSGFPEGFFYASNFRELSTGGLFRLLKVLTPGGRIKVPLYINKETSSLQAAGNAL
jgi:hypothetical protein